MRIAYLLFFVIFLQFKPNTALAQNPDSIRFYKILSTTETLFDTDFDMERNWLLGIVFRNEGAFISAFDMKGNKVKDVLLTKKDSLPMYNIPDLIRVEPNSELLLSRTVVTNGETKRILARYDAEYNLKLLKVFDNFNIRSISKTFEGYLLRVVVSQNSNSPSQIYYYAMNSNFEIIHQLHNNLPMNPVAFNMSDSLIAFSLLDDAKMKVKWFFYDVRQHAFTYSSETLPYARFRYDLDEQRAFFYDDINKDTRQHINNNDTLVLFDKITGDTIWMKGKQELWGGGIYHYAFINLKDHKPLFYDKKCGEIVLATTAKSPFPQEIQDYIMFSKLNEQGEVTYFDTRSLNYVYNLYQTSNSSGLLVAQYINQNFDRETYICEIKQSCETSTFDELKEEILLYPNPSNDWISIAGIEKANIKVLGLDGKLFIEESYTKGRRLNISSLEKGMYIISVLLNNRILTQKFIKL